MHAPSLRAILSFHPVSLRIPYVTGFPKSQPLQYFIMSDETELWPPVAPDISFFDQDSNDLELIAFGQSHIYRLKSNPSLAYKQRGGAREYELAQAAGDCAIGMRGRLILPPKTCDGYPGVHGFLMDVGTPLATWSKAAGVTPGERRKVMNMMIEVVHRLHRSYHVIHGDIKLDNMLLDKHGQVRLCDFEEARYEEEEEEMWQGCATDHYASPDRWRKEGTYGEMPPPTKADDLYALGMSIWELYTGKMPYGEFAQDDNWLREELPKGKTVDVMEVDDEEVREVIKGFLRQGGAHI